ncbi:MAG: hypothetical protein WBK51_13685 [Polaromonas sp.]
MSFLVSLDMAALWRAVSLLVLAWLAFFFGRTLGQGQTPLIERFARIGNPVMTPAFCRYTRRLTGIWCVYFIVAAVASGLANVTPISTGLLVWLGTIALFVGEHRLRPVFFPGQQFPGLWQQVRHTLQVWHHK